MAAKDTPALTAALPVSTSKNQPPSPLLASNAFYRQLAWVIAGWNATVSDCKSALFIYH
jgi:hypothetical protein